MNARLTQAGQMPARMPILPTPGITGPRFHRLRFMSQPAGGEGTPGAPPANDPGGQTPPAPQPPAPKPAPPAPKPSDPQPQDTFSREYVTELRSGAKSNREARQAAEQQLQDLQAERDRYQSELDAVRAESALTAAISDAGGNGIAAMAIKGADVLKDVDTSDADAVKAAVKSFIDDHPELKAAPSAARSGLPGAGGSGEPGQRPKSIREALERASN